MSFKALLAAALLAASAAVQAVPMVSITSSVETGYLPLSLFGTAPRAGMGNDTVQNVPVPAFQWAGQSWTSVGISSNGYVVVGGAGAGDNQAANVSLPGGAAPRNLLAPFWTDLDVTLGGFIRTTVLTNGVSSWIVVDWDAVARADGGGANSFEVWIGINGVEDVWFAYGELSGASNGLLTVGAQDASGTVGANLYHNGAGTLPVAFSEWRVATTDLPVAQVPEPGSIALAGLALLLLAAVARPARLRSVAASAA